MSKYIITYLRKSTSEDEYVDTPKIVSPRKRPTTRVYRLIQNNN